ncbi:MULTISPECIES: response regulator transcription factor [unclassified Neptuniibacter]|jgi:two-component system invasion response regulator UvrY|uniref:response regulator n=1 Tax=unclassified Neptuniibacter TaxID=2630693 RepID=UPI0026E27ACB|nr:MULTISPECIES: response regulator transcription factor [unclassified Neptuniibacter]MDO6514383.1 response regulator transcription factor [Neptuniibacter sp. 2_MG-2023]MDO6594428.1 response regulator transcription factor [Neptuniibacter sp. 1_MG-2023]
MTDPIKILLVDDHPLVRAGFQRLLISDDSIEIVGEADNGQSACDMYATHAPDVVVMDLNMPNDSSTSDEACHNLNGGLEAIRRIISHDAKAKVLVLTAMEIDPFPAHVVNAGAKGFLTKRCAPDELLAAVKAIHNGEEYITEEMRTRINGDGSTEAASIGNLTKRELQIFALLAEGRTVSQVAEEIFLSPKTIHAHRTNIFRKLSISNNSELVHLAIRHGIVQA